MGMGFFLKDAKAEKSAIVAIVRFKGQRYKIYTGESVKVAFWLDGTAATNMLLSGMEASDIMMLGNWSSERSFWKYIRMKPELNAKRLSQHAYFGEGK